MPSKSSSYTESKVDVRLLREAADKVFAYKPSTSKKDSPPAAKHRKRARKGSSARS